MLRGTRVWQRVRTNKLYPLFQHDKDGLRLRCISTPPCRQRCVSTSHVVVPIRSVKTVARRKVKDLAQGAVTDDRCIPQDPDDSPQYSTLLQGVRDNIDLHHNCVVLTRVGNFYELYFEHAKEYGPLLGLKVSSRRTSGKGGPGRIHMAGFPFWQLDRFLKVLVQDLNKYVAVSEEFPVPAAEKVTSGGRMYDRRVTRVITPGTLIDEKFLNPLENNFLLSIEEDDTPHREGGSQDDDRGIGLTWLDLSTGDFFVQSVTKASLPSTLTRIGAREILVGSNARLDVRKEIELIGGRSHELITEHDAEEALADMSNWDAVIEGLAVDKSRLKLSPTEQLAGYRLLDYLHVRLFDLQLKLQPLQRKQMQETLNIDRSSIKGLEILQTAREGFGKGSLFHAVRRTVTNSGSRLLRNRLVSPSASLATIETRLERVDQFIAHEQLRESVVGCLHRAYDVQRLVQKFALNKGDADDLLCLARAINETVQIYALIEGIYRSDSTTGPLFELISQAPIHNPRELSGRIMHAIDEDGLDRRHRLEEAEVAAVASLAQEVLEESDADALHILPKASRKKVHPVDSATEGQEPEEAWTMQRGATETLSRLHGDLESLIRDKQDLIDRLRASTSLPSLTLKWSPTMGHHGHVKSASAMTNEKLEAIDARIIPTASKSTRVFHLSPWSRLGTRIEHAKQNIRSEEQRIFIDLRQHVILNLVSLRQIARVMDELDVSAAFAVLAQERGWTRPQLHGGVSHRIVGGRHPTVTLGLEEQGRMFVRNDCFLGDDERVWIVTGPNMGGKSTFLRQNALITILAQVGSYVPAEHAELGIVDRIFSRIGAADDLFRDQSTFMVEMAETATILKYATPRSFVIMDEVGRGTTPEDGTAVAYASLYHLYHTNRCRTLFATHFHRLVDMTADWPHIGRYCTDVAEEPSGSFAFVHQLRPGVNKQSHALQVARIAGLPESALAVARQVIEEIDAPARRACRHPASPSARIATPAAAR